MKKPERPNTGNRFKDYFRTFLDFMDYADWAEKRIEELEANLPEKIRDLEERKK